MIKVEIGDNEYDLPQGWEEVSLQKFERIAKHSSLLNEFKSETLFALEMFALLLDAPIEDIKKLNRGAFAILTEKCEWANKEIKPKKRNKFDIDGITYIPVKNLDALSMGDSISLEMMINESDDSDILTNIMPILLRKAKKVLKGDKEVMVPSEFDADEYAETRELFRKRLMVTDVIEFKTFFLNGVK